MESQFFDLFLGPKAENEMLLRTLLEKVISFHAEYRKSIFPYDASLYPEQGGHAAAERLTAAVEELLKRSTKNIPSFHPRYTAQMLKDPPISALLGNIAFQLTNPNNHAFEGGPVTTEMEMEVTDMLLGLIGYPAGWGHLASGGSLANLEALWAVRDFYPKGAIYFSEASHYSWKRICTILGIDRFEELPVNAAFRLDLNVLEERLKKNPASMVMANFGSTGTGSVDDIEGILSLKQKYNFHLHIDAAYGGFTRTLLLNPEGNLLPFSAELGLSEFVYKQALCIPESDSITIDPHKHGLLPYGSGAVLYKNQALRSIMDNSAPYTYHKTDKPNIGMFSLEGSRPGAAAAACWLTYKTIPLDSAGLGTFLKASYTAAQSCYRLLVSGGLFTPVTYPDLDILCFFPAVPKTISFINEQTLYLYSKFSIEAADAEYILSKFVISPQTAGRVFPQFPNPAGEQFVSLRSVFMKHWAALDNFRYVKSMVDSLNTALQERLKG